MLIRGWVHERAMRLVHAVKSRNGRAAGHVRIEVLGCVAGRGR